MTLLAKVENAKTIREWRAFRRLSKAAVAKALGVHPATYAKMEDNPFDISIRDAHLLSEVFQCQVHELNFFE